MSFRSAYLKLTFFYVAIIMMISVFFSFSIFQVSSAEIDRSLGRQAKIFNDLPQFGGPQLFSNQLEEIRREQTNIAKKTIKKNLLYINLFILIGSSVLSYLFAKRTLKPIEEMVEAQNRFTADASHELKIPLTAMKTEIEVSLRNDKLSIGEAKKLSISNLEEIEKLETLSNALLNLAKYQYQAKNDFLILSLEDLVTESFQKLEALAKAKNISFENNFQKVKVAGDKSSLIELFVILIDNAIKYSPKDSKVEIKIEICDKHACVSVKDYGCGIPKESQKHIFDRFYRADSSRNKEKANGFGLGLSIAKNIVDFHKGEITVKSDGDKGSKFVVKLPIAKS